MGKPLGFRVRKSRRMEACIVGSGGIAYTCGTWMGCCMTVHIAPEPEYSYVSLESSVSSSNYYELPHRVIDAFQPGKFTVTGFASKTSPAQMAARELDRTKMIGVRQRRDIRYCRFQTYDLTYAHYSKFPS